MSEESLSISNKLAQVAKMPKYRGAIFQIEADEKGLALIDIKESSLKVYLMVDPDSDIILETRFFTYGGPIFTALADTFCSLIQNKTVEEASSIKISEIESLLRDTPHTKALPEDAVELELLQKLILNIKEVYPEKKNVALAAREAMETIKYKTQTVEGRAEADAEWNALSHEEKLQKIEDCLHEYVRDTLRMDGGDLEVLALTKDNRLQIRFQGACAGCGSAMGGTLFYIEDQLKNNVYYNIVVEPEDPFASYPPLTDEEMPKTLTP